MDDLSREDYMKILMFSEEVSLPRSASGKRELMNKLFLDFCVLVEEPEGRFHYGRLNSTNCVGYSMTIEGKQKQFSYSNLVRLFRPPFLGCV